MFVSFLALGCSPNPAGKQKMQSRPPVSVETPRETGTQPESPPNPETADTAQEVVPGPLIIEDMAPSSGYDDAFGGNWKRGRAAVVFDIDGDGDFDVFSGNPGDTSYMLMNVSEGGVLQFEQGQVLDEAAGLWGGTAADYDNDGDPDLFVTVGGNEANEAGVDRLYENRDGVLFDVSTAAAIHATDATGKPMMSNHTGGFFWDLDNDGLLDIFSNHHLVDEGPLPASGLGRNNFFMNQSNGLFRDDGPAFGIVEQESTRTSSYLDFDNDGDLDLYENNWSAPSVLWKNLLMETGSVRFVKVTREMSLGGGSLSFPRQGAMASVARDFNQDGWEDLFMFRRGELSEMEPEVHPLGHLMWINLQGTGFVEVSEHTGVNVGYRAGPAEADKGVMGSQAGDLNADSIPDLYMGHGGPPLGREDHLFVSTGLITVSLPELGDVVVPTYENWASHIDFPSESEALNPDFEGGLYPYRTHGTTFADYDGDGLYELGVHNGGRSIDPAEETRSPNQLWKFTFPIRPHWIRVDLKGDGVVVPFDPVGARVRARVASPTGERWVYDTRRSGSGFGAQNDPDVFLGLGDATDVLEMWVTWPGSLGEQQIVVAGMDRKYSVSFAL